MTAAGCTRSTDPHTRQGRFRQASPTPAGIDAADGRRGALRPGNRSTLRLTRQAGVSSRDPADLLSKKELGVRMDATDANRTALLLDDEFGSRATQLAR